MKGDVLPGQTGSGAVYSSSRAQTTAPPLHTKQSGLSHQQHKTLSSAPRQEKCPTVQIQQEKKGRMQLDKAAAPTCSAVLWV